MKRGDLYRVYKPSRKDPKKFRVFVVVSRNILIQSHFSTVICAPIYSKYDSLSSQVSVGVEVGLKHASAIHCDELMSIEKSRLTDFVGSLPGNKILELNKSLRVALALE